MVTYSATTCRNRLYFILTIKTVTSAQKTTKRNDHNEKVEIGVEFNPTDSHGLV